MKGSAGFEELPHTADWALRVWAPSLEALLEQAARGMYALSGIEIVAQPELSRALEFSAADAETLLVDFLGELLYIAESERVAFNRFDITVAALHSRAVLEGGPILTWKKEIKAVTYSDLAIRPTEAGLEVEIVFDV